MKYLITGGCGFIGSNFADLLLSRGDEVTLLDNLSRKGTITNLDFLKNKYQDKIKFIHLDVRMHGLVLNKLVEEVDVVYHLAGQVAVTTSVLEPREDFEVNVIGAFNILEAIRLSKKMPILVYASTNKVYGGMEDLKTEMGEKGYRYTDFPDGIAETRGLDLHSPYGCSKGASDQYIRDYARMYGLKTVVMRQSCIYGTRQFGVEDQGWVAWFSIAAVLGKKLTIYGDGNQVRDVLFVRDLFDVWDLVVKNIEITKGQVYNIGGGHKFSMSLLQLISILESKLKIKLDPIYSNRRPGDQLVYISDIRKIKEAVSWEPKTSPMDGVTQLIDWTKENEEVIRKQLS